jgi:hypothetical protein
VKEALQRETVRRQLGRLPRRIDTRRQQVLMVGGSPDVRGRFTREITAFSRWHEACVEQGPTGANPARKRYHADKQ